MASSVFTDARSVQLVVTNQLGNATTTTITEPVPTLTQPTGDGVINLGHGGQETCSWLDLLFFGVGTDSQMFAANVYGWELEKSQSGKHDLWIPRLLAGATSITLDSAQPGVAGTDIPAADYLAVAITLAVGNANYSSEVVSPGHALHEIASLSVETKGCRFAEIRFAMGSTSAAATSGNCLAKRR